MTETYLQIMIESLEKKNQVLDCILELDKRQLELAANNPIDMQEYDKTMDEKGLYIDELNKLDEGFSNTYELVKNTVQASPQQYRELVLQMQELIRTAVDKGVEVNVLEQRGKRALDMMFKNKRKDIRQMKVTSSAASRYYKAMSRINDVDPQLMDKKK